MGILGKISEKIGNAMEKSASKHMTGNSKKVYEEEEQKLKDLKEMQIPEQLIEYKFSKDELKDLNTLLIKAELIDDKNLWIGGLPNFKVNQNSRASNLFSGKKNLRFFTVRDEIYYFALFEKDILKVYRAFKKEHIVNVEAKSKLIGGSTLKIELIDGKVFTIDVTENKENFEAIKTLLT